MGLLGSADRLGSVCISLHEWECAQRIADNRSVSEVEDLNADSPEAKSPPKKLEIHWNRDETKPFLDECVAMGLIAVPATLEDPRSFDPERSEAILCWDRMAPSWGEERLYTLRRFSEEVTLARKIVALATKQQTGEAIPAPEIKDLEAQQIKGIEKALNSQFSVISGGPGTGKTTTVVYLIESLLGLKAQQNADQKAVSPEAFRIGLAAPTGKATARMTESIDGNLARTPEHFTLTIPFIEAAKSAKVGYEARTIHKWLVTPSQEGYRPSREHPLELDLLIVDEASMVDASLANRLFDVINPARTRVIMLGDKNQLAAVGPGSVFADLSNEKGALADVVTVLTHSRRFKTGSIIDTLSRGINAGNVEVVKPLLLGSEDSDKYVFHSYADEPDPRVGLSKSAQRWLEATTEQYRTALVDYVKLLKEKDHATRAQFQAQIDKILEALSHFRALAAQRQGIQSVKAINTFMTELVQQTLQEAKADNDLLDNKDGGYLGRVIIIRHNDEALNVFNGDVGVMLYCPACLLEGMPEGFYVVFEKDKQAMTGSDSVFYAPTILPRYETAFAITIHQSQGSEFEHVGIFMPYKADSSLATRELLYTGVTRTKKEVALFGREDVILRSVEQPTVRSSGLSTRLFEAK